MTQESFWSKEFPVISVTRADLIAARVPRAIVEKLTDEQMQQIASKIEDLYSDGGYWDDVRAATEYVVEHPGGESGEKPSGQESAS